MVEVFDPASTRGFSQLKVKVKVKVKIKVKVTSRLVVCRQSVRLSVKPLETHEQKIFFSSEPLKS
jgi:hypothetical protein